MPDPQYSRRRSDRASDQAFAITNLALASAQPLAAYVTKLTGKGVSEAERAKAVDGPVSPAPGAFVIWLPLFATSIGYGARVARHARPLPSRSVAWLMSAAYSCNAAWSLQAQLRGLGWPSVAIIVAAASSASAALIRAERLARAPRRASLPMDISTRKVSTRRLSTELVSAPQDALQTGLPELVSEEARAAARAIAPLAGWLTLAAFANIEATLNDTGRRPRQRPEARRAVALLGGACAAAGAVAAASRGNRLYTAAVAWGLGGVVVRNLRDRKPLVAAAAGAGLCAALGATIFGRRWFAGGA